MAALLVCLVSVPVDRWQHVSVLFLGRAASAQPHCSVHVDKLFVSVKH